MWKLFILPHPFTIFELQKYYQNRLKFNVIYSKNNLSKIKDGKYIINFDNYESIRTHRIALFVNAENLTYFDSFGVDHIPKEITKSIGNKNIITNIYRIKASDLTMFGYFCIGFYWFHVKK